VSGSCRRWGGLLALGALSWGCGDDASRGQLVVTKPADDTTEVRAHWPYASFEVDVDLLLVTRSSPEGCVSTARLTVDEALSSVTHYDLAPTACSELELTETGDIVVNADPTGHNWADESLAVDTDKKLIILGPAEGTDATGERMTYTFTLSSPPCPDQPECSCGVLRRSSSGGNVDLSLGKRC
jgi:hypothetical protein